MAIVSATPLPTLILVTMAVAAMAGCSVRVDLGDDVDRRTETESVDAAGIERLAVTTGNGRVEVVGGDVEEIEVTATIEEQGRGDGTVTIDRTGADLAVDGECDAGRLDRCSVGFRIVVPADVDVAVTTGNGAIELVGLDAEITAVSGNGAVDGRELRSPTVEATTGNGRITLDLAVAPSSIVARSGKGAIGIRLPDDGTTYDVDADSGNGRVDVDVPDDPGADHRVTVHSDNGAVDIGVAS
jgi:hypothetical protein